ncbi:MAG TPA: hypothetical protein P5082_13395 [Treponema sp.]|nr:hypothetical protein [Treponema sp.]
MKRNWMNGVAMVMVVFAAALTTVTCASTPTASSNSGTAQKTEQKAEQKGGALPPMNMGTNPYVFESFERITEDGKIYVGINPKKTYVNLTNEGWGGNKGLKISSSTEYVTEGKYSAKIEIDFKITSRLQTNGGCFGLGWDNTGAIDPVYAKRLVNAEYMLIDYVWIPAPECTISNPKVINLGIHLAGRDDSISDKSKGELGDMANTDPSGKGTHVVRVKNKLSSLTTLVPQFAIKVYHPSDDQDPVGLKADVGKVMKGTLYLDNLRFADKDGNVIQK